jgi:hypothetical protein
MRVTIDPVTASQLETLARYDGRHAADALRAVVAEAVRQRHGIKNRQTPVDDAATIRGTTVAAHVNGTVLHGIRRFADKEGRSLSSAMRQLLKVGLRSYGLLAPAEAD